MQHLELMVSYIKELCPLHLKHNRFIEAAFTLKVHSELLSWSNDTLPSFLRNPSRYPSSETHYQLKEALYIDIIDYFNQGEVKCLLLSSIKNNFIVKILRCGNVL